MEEPSFANQAERECASLLDFYGIAWSYEPRTFLLDVDDDGVVREAFTPDFHLCDLDIYIEVTTMRQALVTRKHRKLRRMREQYPDVNVKLFARRDIERLAVCHGLALEAEVA